MTNRMQDALAAWDALPAEERSYAKVAEVLGVTTGRAADYTRSALNEAGRSAELPQRGRGGSTDSLRAVEVLRADRERLELGLDLALDEAVRAVVIHLKPALDRLSHVVAHLQARVADRRGERHLEDRRRRDLADDVAHGSIDRLLLLC
jgi:hypothetical protein